MLLYCPRCDSQHLNNASHGTSICPRCGGMFVPRGRVEELASDPPPADGDAAGVAGEAVRCPADRSIMSRASVEAPNGGKVYVDRCGSCRGIWFDAGEWSTLASAHLLDHLDEFWTVEWRNRQRREVEKSRYDERMREELGAALYERLLELARELRGNPRRSQALALLREESGR